MSGEVGEDAGVDQVAQGVAIGGRLAEEGRGLVSRRRRCRPAAGPCRAARWWRATLEDALLERGREAAGGLAEAALEELDDALWERQLARGSSVSSGSRLLATRNSAMSPTTFDVGVTLTMSPKRTFTSAYASQTSVQREARPSALACWKRFVYWPPGIS